jgi:hypothetical protein
MKYSRLLLTGIIPQRGCKSYSNKSVLRIASRLNALIQGLPWADAAWEWLAQLRNQTIAEFTLIGTTLAMLAAIVAAVAAIL